MQKSVPDQSKKQPTQTTTNQTTKLFGSLFHLDFLPLHRKKWLAYFQSTQSTGNQDIKQRSHIQQANIDKNSC